jgi:hypothetical protein
MAESRIGQTLTVVINGRPHEVECVSENDQGQLHWTTEDSNLIGTWSKKLWDISRAMQGRTKEAKRDG